jgi:hypothetical protein
VRLAIGSDGHPFLLVTNGVNAVLSDLATGRQAGIRGLGFVRDFEIRASDGKGFALATTYVPNTDTTPCPFCEFKAVDSVIELDSKRMQLTASHALPSPRGSLLMSRQSVAVIIREDTSSTILTLNETNGTFVRHAIPVGAEFLVANDWAGSVYLYQFHNYPGTAAGQRDRMLVYDRATGRSSDATDALRPPAGEQVMGLLFRS